MTAIHWLSPVDGTFSTASDWAGGGVPGPDDVAVLPAPTQGDSYTVTSSGAVTVDKIQTGSGAVLDLGDGVFTALAGTGRPASDGEILIGSHASFVTSGTFVNRGEISGFPYSTIVDNGTITDSGGIFLDHKSKIEIDGSLVVTKMGRLVASTRPIHISGTGTLDNAGFVYLGGFVGGRGFTIENRSTGLIQFFNLGVLNTRNGTITNAGTIINGTVASPLSNTGTLVANGGTDFVAMVLEKDVTGSGIADIVGFGSLHCLAQFDEAVNFTPFDDSQTLELAFSRNYTNTISGFSTHAKTYLDLLDIGFVGAGEATYRGTKTAGVLTVTDGTTVAHIHLAGDYQSCTFVAESDGKGGTRIHAETGGSQALPTPHRLTQAMAALPGPAGGTSHFTEFRPGEQPMLAGPHAAVA